MVICVYKWLKVPLQIVLLQPILGINLRPRTLNKAERLRIISIYNEPCLPIEGSAGINPEPLTWKLQASAIKAKTKCMLLQSLQPDYRIRLRIADWPQEVKNYEVLNAKWWNFRSYNPFNFFINLCVPTEFLSSFQPFFEKHDIQQFALHLLPEFSRYAKCCKVTTINMELV